MTAPELSAAQGREGMSELSACPFCGGVATMMGSYVRDGWSVACSCGASMRAFNPDAVAHSIERWNRRATPPAQAAELSDERAAFEKWARSAELPVEGLGNGAYADDGTHDAWVVWQAARATPPAQAHCVEGPRCVCGGDTPGVRATCSNWRAAPPAQAVGREPTAKMLAAAHQGVWMTQEYQRTHTTTDMACEIWRAMFDVYSASNPQAPQIAEGTGKRCPECGWVNAHLHDCPLLDAALPQEAAPSATRSTASVAGDSAAAGPFGSDVRSADHGEDCPDLRPPPSAPDVAALVKRLDAAETDYTTEWGNGDLYGKAKAALEREHARANLEENDRVAAVRRARKAEAQRDALAPNAQRYLAMKDDSAGLIETLVCTPYDQWDRVIDDHRAAERAAKGV